MGHVNIAQRDERLSVGTERLQLLYGNLNVNHRLGLQTRNRRRAVVVDATRESPERPRNPISFLLEFQNPAWVVRRDLQPLDLVGCGVVIYDENSRLGAVRDLRKLIRRRVVFASIRNPIRHVGVRRAPIPKRGGSESLP